MGGGVEITMCIVSSGTRMMCDTHVESAMGTTGSLKKHLKRQAP